MTAKFTTHAIISQSGENASNVNVSQKTEAGVSKVINPAFMIDAHPPIISRQGTAETTLNGVKAGADGTSQTTVSKDKDGIARFNLSTSAENGFNDIMDSGAIRSSINFEVDLKAGSALIDTGSVATTFPSFAIYSYTIVNGQVKTEVILQKPEESPDDLKKPMQPLPDQTQKGP